MIDSLGKFCQQWSGLTHKVRFNFKSIDQSFSRAGFGDFANLCGGQIQMQFRLRASRMVERETSNEFRIQCLRAFDRANDFALHVFIEWHELVVRSITDVQQLHFADTSTDAGDFDTVFGVKFFQLSELFLAEFCDVFDFSVTQNVDKSRAVIADADRCQGGHLFQCGAAIRCFIGKRANDD